jgi:4-hydroxybenzoate polyprenyltransferase
LSFVLSSLLLLAIFSFKNRKRQLLLCKFLFVGLLLQILMSNHLCSGNSLKWNSILPYLSIVLTFLAYRAIQSDERLVRSADRLR